MSLGCRCTDCPLREDGKGPVLPELRPDAQILVIGEAPGEKELEQGMPFCGASGKLLEYVLRQNGLHRGDVSLSNALLCRPPQELRVYMRRLSVRNKARRKRGEKPWPSPVECCSERVRSEVRDAKAVLTLGAAAYASVTGSAVEESGLMRMRGYPQGMEI